ncbi:phage tail protein [Burkholderia ubonensis]|uniref:phage tail protein n=1 Tax=Burkholderia ubonensis TaxID=101571 RepID=UPI0007581375|nr:phage tail protein [Burkholderia ubonensis]KVZ57507.1 phage tail protein [Burkholderia ubonensis]
MPDTFTWTPTVAQYAGTAKLRVRKAQFGDGYEQTLPDGINNRVLSYTLQFVGGSDAIAAILAFLDAHVGVAFYWSPPLRQQLLFKCEAYTDAIPDNGTHAVTATFTQTFDIGS